MDVDLADYAAFLPFLAVGFARTGGLDHPTRVRICTHLLSLPGDHFRSIARTLQLGVGETRRHLDILLRSGLVREERTNGKCRYYLCGEDCDPDRNEVFAKHWDYRDVRSRVLLQVRTSDQVGPTEIAAKLGISRQLAAYHLANLELRGLVAHEGRAYRTP